MFLLTLAFVPVSFSQSVKVIHIPDNVKIEKNVARETFVHNLSADGIYESTLFSIIDGFIYLGKRKPIELIKLNPEGKIVKRVGRNGQGPGEFMSFGGIREFKGNIAVLDTVIFKIVILNKDLDFLEELKLRLPFFDFLVDKKNNFIFYGEPAPSYYFSKYTENGKLIKKFSTTMTTPAENRKIMQFDTVRYSLYIPEEDGIWACFCNRYDLRYYKREILSVEIKARKNFFKGEKQSAGGRDIVLHLDRAVHLARNKGNLFYIYRIDKDLFCDIFSLQDYRLLRRFKFNINYSYVIHNQDNIFYALMRATNEDEDLLLYKLEI